MNLDRRISRLIAVGASVAANCQPCLQTNAAKALENGASEAEIAAAIEVGKMVRQGAATKMDAFASSLSQATPASAGSPVGGCGCSS